MCEAGVTHWSSGQRRMESDTEAPGSSDPGGSFEVDDFSPPGSLEADINVVEDHGGPKPYQFKPLTRAPVRPRARSFSIRGLSCCSPVIWCKRKLFSSVAVILQPGNTAAKSPVSRREFFFFFFFWREQKAFFKLWNVGLFFLCFFFKDFGIKHAENIG